MCIHYTFLPCTFITTVVGNSRNNMSMWFIIIIIIVIIPLYWGLPYFTSPWCGYNRRQAHVLLLFVLYYHQNVNAGREDDTFLFLCVVDGVLNYALSSTQYTQNLHIFLLSSTSHHRYAKLKTSFRKKTFISLFLVINTYYLRTNIK